MKRLLVAICLATTGGSGVGLAAHPALAGSFCVGSGPGCYATIQGALNTAHDGDVIHIGSGTFAGPITIATSVKIIGAGEGATIIRGGGPVVTILPSSTLPQPTVSINGVTITGGLNRSSPTPFLPQAGGLAVPSAASGGPGATVSITSSIITGNAVSPSGSGDCGSGCTFAVAFGGGIANEGTMTLTNTVVSNNVASVPGAAATYNGSFGGGIENTSAGTLTLHNATIVGNSVGVSTTSSNFLFAGGGGIDTGGALTMDRSTVSANRVTVSSTNTDPNSDLSAYGGGGIDVEPGATAVIRGSVIADNRATVTGYGGFIVSSGGGLLDRGSLLLVGGSVRDNQTVSTITSTLPTPSAETDGGAMEVIGSLTIIGTSFTGNSASATSPAAGTAPDSVTSSTGGALLITSQSATITGSVFSGNRAAASTMSGAVTAQGGAIFNGGSVLTLRDSIVTNNTAVATGPGGVAQGGGIYNGSFPDTPAPQLTLINSQVTHNTLVESSPGITVQGGGLFTTVPVTLTNSVLAKNSPDQCFGC